MAKKKSAGQRAPKADVYAKTTEKIIALMETGKLPWQQGWDRSIGASLVCPINGKSGKRYARLNSVFLSFVMAEKESGDPRFFTMGMLNAQNRIFRERVAQKREQGQPVNPEMEWQYGVRKGAKSELIQMAWKQTKDKYGNPLPEDEQYWAKRFCNVFHASDCVRREYLKDKDGNPVLNEDGKNKYIEHPLKAYVPKGRFYTHEEQYEIAEGILAASGAKIIHDVPSVKKYPCYTVDNDTIHLPPKQAFSSLGEYYATALHELSHWTCHESRLNRDVSGDLSSEAYAREELRAELSSAYLALDLGLPMNPTNHAAYVQHWIKDLKEDNMAIFTASNEARKIADYVKGFMPERFRSEELTIAETDTVDLDAVQETATEEKTVAKEEPIAGGHTAAEEDSAAAEAEESAAATADAVHRVADTAELTLPSETLTRETARFYKYLLTQRPADVGALPKEHLYLVDPDDSAARYGAVYYEKQLPASVAAAHELTPDYRYFANKSMHVTLHQRRRDAAPEGAPSYLQRDYEVTLQENYIRTDAMRTEGLDRIFAHLCVHPPEEGRPIAEGDLIETDGRIFRVADVGFVEQELNAHQGDFVLTPLVDERVRQLSAAAEESIGADAYRLYTEKLRETFYRAEQDRNTLSAHPGKFAYTDDPREGVRISGDEDYAKGFRERAYQNGLSSYTPTDERGWKKADTAYAVEEFKRALADDADNYLKLDEIRSFVADDIQRNSPYAAISQDRSYGKELVRNAEKDPSIKELLSVNEVIQREPAIVEEYTAKYSR